MFDAYFDKCVSSVLNQTFNDFECLVVFSNNENDYLLKHEYNDDKLVFVKNDKTDQGSKRNAGICCSKGNYIVFLDCDDCLNIYFLEYAYSSIKRYGSIDLIAFGYTRELNYLNEYIDQGFFEYNIDIIKSIIFSEYMSKKYEIDIAFDSIWSKVYKKKIMLDYNVRFVEGLKCAEDAVFVMNFASHVNNAFFDDSFKSYFWRKNPNSTMNNVDSGYLNLEGFTREIISVLKTQASKYWDNLDNYLTYIFKRNVTNLIKKYYSNSISYKHFYCLINDYFLNATTLLNHLVFSSIKLNSLKIIYLCMEKHNMKYLKRIIIEKIKFRLFNRRRATS